MQIVSLYGWWLLAMLALVLCSAFFSCSEAALFYLRRQDRRAFRAGTSTQRIAVRLLDNPDRLLTAVLFWNLVINIVYFALASIVALKMNNQAEAGLFSLLALLILIIFSEMLPKSLAVQYTRSLSALVAIPMSVALRLVSPIIPTLRFINILSQRLILPNFSPEPYLELSDLERAIQLSTSDASLLEQEETVLQNIVSLSAIRVDELMRPRTQCLTFTTPISLQDLDGRMPPSGHILVTSRDDDVIEAAIPLKYLSDIPKTNLEQHAETAVYVPWCTSAAGVLEAMRRSDRKVAVVVNEFGETIGIVTFDDILDTIFTYSPSRSERLLSISPIEQIEPGLWQVTGMTTLKRIARYFETELPESKSITVAGIIQEVLQRMPVANDQCDWGPFHLRVIELIGRGGMTVELTQQKPQEQGRP